MPANLTSLRHKNNRTFFNDKNKYIELCLTAQQNLPHGR